MLALPSLTATARASSRADSSCRCAWPASVPSRNSASKWPACSASTARHSRSASSVAPACAAANARRMASAGGSAAGSGPVPAGGSTGGIGRTGPAFARGAADARDRADRRIMRDRTRAAHLAYFPDRRDNHRAGDGCWNRRPVPFGTNTPTAMRACHAAGARRRAGRARHHGRSTQLAVLGGPRRHVHRHRRAAPGRHADDAQAPVGEPRAVRRRGRPRHPRAARTGRGRADSAGRDRCREDGDDRRDQRAARTQGRAHAARDHAGIRRRAQDRLPEPAEALRAADRAPVAALRARDRGGRAHRRARRARAAARPGRRARDAAGRARRRHPRGRDRADARVPVSAARAGDRRSRARDRLSAGLGVARGVAADEARVARRHDGGGRVPVADPAALRASRSSRR